MPHTWLNSIPPGMVLNEREWVALDDLVQYSAMELRESLPRRLRIYLDDAAAGRAVEIH